jgi:hypothetical protein
LRVDGFHCQVIGQLVQQDVELWRLAKVLGADQTKVEGEVVAAVHWRWRQYERVISDTQQRCTVCDAL